jgi:hypothetical protein
VSNELAIAAIKWSKDKESNGAKLEKVKLFFFVAFFLNDQKHM